MRITNRRQKTSVSIKSRCCRLLELLEDLEARLAAGESVYVHCWGGRGRAGLVAACFLQHAYGVSGEEALQRVGRAYDTRGDTGMACSRIIFTRLPIHCQHHDWVRCGSSLLLAARRLQIARDGAAAPVGTGLCRELAQLTADMLNGPLH